MQMLRIAQNPTAEIQKMFSNDPSMDKFIQMTNGANPQQIEDKTRQLAISRNISEQQLNEVAMGIQQGKYMDIYQVRQALGI